MTVDLLGKPNEFLSKLRESSELSLAVICIIRYDCVCTCMIALVHLFRDLYVSVMLCNFCVHVTRRQGIAEFDLACKAKVKTAAWFSAMITESSKT